MHLTEVAPHRWLVRKDKRSKPLGTIEYHEFWTYRKGVRTKAGFWISRPRNSGWKESSWSRVASKKAAIAALL